MEACWLFMLQIYSIMITRVINIILTAWVEHYNYDPTGTVQYVPRSNDSVVHYDKCRSSIYRTNRNLKFAHSIFIYEMLKKC